jgi:coenzyme Q-binding protein COQ10
MTRIEKKALIDAPVEQVYQYVCMIPKLTEWWTSLTNVRNYGDGKAVKGATYEWTYKMLGIPLDGKTEVTEMVPNRRAVTKATGALPNTIEQTFEDAGGGKTSYTMRVDYTIPGSILGKIADKLFVERFNERECEHVVGNLKTICEAHAAAGVPAGR